MGTMHLHPASQPNMPAVARILSRYDRESLEAFLEVALELLDTMDGNPDLEDDDPAEEDDDSGDHASEDEPAGYRAQSRSDFGPGCPISDPGGGNVEDDAQIDSLPPYTGPLH